MTMIAQAKQPIPQRFSDKTYIDKKLYFEFSGDAHTYRCFIEH